MVSAFSIPKAKRDDKSNINPGPGQYNPEVSPKVEPKYSFGKETRADKHGNVPGPGTYENKNDYIKDSKPKYSLGSRRVGPDHKYNVGPGAYEPTYNYSKDKSPAYSFYGRSQSQFKGNKVGPGQYQIKSQIDAKKSGHHFGKDRRQQSDKKVVPGPGSYEYQGAVFKYGSKVEPSYGFGSRLNDPSSLKVPGPGQYEGTINVYSRIGGIMSREMRSQNFDNKTPGPGNYNHDFNKVRNHDPSWSLSKSSRENMSKSNAIGPGAYEHDKNYKSLVKTNKGYHFGSDKKLKYDILPVPGPGTYNGQHLKSRKSIKIGEKLTDMSASQTPGPGTYQNEKYDYQSWAKGKGRYSVGKSAREGFEGPKVPGPGNYQPQNITSFRGKVAFSRDPKLKAEKNANPGPGEYTLKPTFADVPKYLLPDKS